MIVYHGSTEIVKRPDVLHSYRNLDFGKGFYVTTVKEQAQRWALKEIRVYPKYDQIAFVKQNAIDQLLVYKSFEEV